MYIYSCASGAKHGGSNYQLKLALFLIIAGWRRKTDSVFKNFKGRSNTWSIWPCKRCTWWQRIGRFGFIPKELIKQLYIEDCFTDIPDQNEMFSGRISLSLIICLLLTKSIFSWTMKLFLNTNSIINNQYRNNKETNNVLACKGPENRKKAMTKQV